jgi:mRNA interferase ChpB
MKLLERGDIVSVELAVVLDAGVQTVQRLALVLTTSDFNQLGEAVVAAITQSSDVSRYAGFAIALAQAGCATQGVVLANKLHVVDLLACHAQWVERVPPQVVDDALARLMTLFE